MRPLMLEESDRGYLSGVSVEEPDRGYLSRVSVMLYSELDSQRFGRTPALRENPTGILVWHFP